MDEQPLVSVIIPAWNAEKRIDRCLRDVTAQTVTAQEILVVDDGSSDGTWERILAWQQQDPRIVPLRQENGGVSSARNLGLAHARGIWVRFVDVDDSVPADSLAVLLERARQAEADLVLGGFTEVRGPIRRCRNLLHRGDAMDCSLFLHLFSARPNAFFYGVVWNKLFRRSLLEAHACRFDESFSWGEDFAFLCDTLCWVRRVAFTPRSVYDYHLSPKGLTWRMALKCLRHPIEEIKLKLTLYRRYQALFAHHGCSEKYRRRMLRYLWGTTVGD